MRAPPRGGPQRRLPWLEAEKRLGYPLEAFARLHGNCRALIIGSGPEEAALRRQAGLLGLQGRVVFAGMQCRLGEPLVSGADAFVLPSSSERFGIALAMVMYPGRRHKRVSDGEQELLVPPGNVETLARAMDYIAANPDRARQMMGRGRAESGWRPLSCPATTSRLLRGSTSRC